MANRESCFKTMKGRRRPAVFSLLMLLLLSCKSIPQVSEGAMDETGFAPLPPGAAVYLFADVRNARPILNNLDLYSKSDKQIQQIIDKTNFAIAAANMPPSAEPQAGEAEGPQLGPRLPLLRYQLVAWGAGYPASGAGVALGASRDWKKNKSLYSGAEYWHSDEAGISVALTAKQIFMSAVTWHGLGTSPDPFPPEPGVEMPEGFSEFRKGAVLSCWINDPSPGLNKMIAEMGISLEVPAERLYISIFPGENRQYTAQLRIEAPTALQARGLLALFLRVRGYLSFLPLAAGENPNPAAFLASILFANPPVHEVKFLTITTKPLNAGEVALLFNLFSL